MELNVFLLGLGNLLAKHIYYVEQLIYQQDVFYAMGCNIMVNIHVGSVYKKERLPKVEKDTHTFFHILMKIQRVHQEKQKMCLLIPGKH